MQVVSMDDSTQENTAPSSALAAATIEALWQALPALGKYLGQECADLEPVVAQELHALPPVPLVAFVGPSGAGKSTVFKLLTGIDTATSNSIRPCSFVPCLGIPPDLMLDDACSLLPGMELVKRGHPDDARNRDAPLNRLLYTESRLDGVIACDLPDIDGAVEDNHERARRVISLADRLVFTCSVHTYANKLVVEAFAEVLSMLADGDVVVLVTQFHAASRDALLETAHRLKDDLVSRLLPHSKAFSPERKDAFGTAVLTRASNARFFYSSYSAQPTLEDILSLSAGESTSEAFGSALSARNLARSRAERQLGRLRKLEARTSELLQAFHRKSDTIDRDLETLKELAESAIPKTLATESLSHFLPLARVLELTIEQAHTVQGNSATRVLRWMGWPVRKLLQTVLGLLAKQDSSPFDEADAKIRKTATERLLESPALVSNQDASLSRRYGIDPATLAPMCDAFVEEPLRDFQDLANKWDKEVRREATDWCNDERNWALVALLLYAEPLITPLIAGGTVGLLIWDLSVGGLGTALIVLLKSVAGGTAVILGPQVADFLMTGAQADIRRRVDRLRRKWIRKYRRQVTRMLESKILNPYAGKLVRSHAAARDAMLPTVSTVTAARQALRQSIDHIRGVLESTGSPS
jgi:energy-coupling factor transporter ATP-binding protein EcfA2